MSVCCVVCERVISGEAQYANAWERTRKRLPCCSPACVAAFDPDRHWIPAVLPALADDDEQARLRKLARERLVGLDLPGPVVRELLQAGLPSARLRGLVAEASAASASARSENQVGFVLGLLQRRFGRQNPDQRTEADYAAAVADLDRWDAEVARRAP